MCVYLRAVSIFNLHSAEEIESGCVFLLGPGRVGFLDQRTFYSMIVNGPSAFASVPERPEKYMAALLGSCGTRTTFNSIYDYKPVSFASNRQKTHTRT